MKTINDLKKGDFITVIYAHVMTNKFVAKFDHQTETHIIYKLPRKRKFMQIKKSAIHILLFGNVPEAIMVDSDFDVMRGNTMLNLVYTGPRPFNEGMEVMKEYIENNNLLPMDDDKKSRILLFKGEDSKDSEYNSCLENCMYPDTMTSSSLLHSIRER